MNPDVEGRHALLFDDDDAAAFVNSREALVPCNYDASLLIDRYDVRHLLDRIPPRPVSSGRRQLIVDDDCDGVSLVEIDRERYQDLPAPVDKEGVDLGSEAREKSEQINSGAYQTVPFSYGNENMSADHDNSAYNSAFRPPFEVPEFLLSHLPPTEKVHKIMARTALFVSEHGGQTEIVLRVKQGDNPTFGFLMPDNHQHAYFRYLVDHPQLLQSCGNSVKSEEKSGKHASGPGALSLLGTLYGNEEDEDATLHADAKGSDLPNLGAVSNESGFSKSEPEDPQSVVLGTKEATNLISSTGSKEKSVSAKKSFSGSASAVSVNKVAADGNHTAAQKLQSFRDSLSVLMPSIVEPPSFLKRTMEKIVEFIVRNGKQFEAILIEQDKNFGRFPFLLPSNQYHSYYIKILEEAHELKRQARNICDPKHDAEKHNLRSNKKVDWHAKGSKVFEPDLAALSEGRYYDPARKEKFKMVLGCQKKDLQDQPSKAAKKSGLSTDEAAAVVLAATRGPSPANVLQRKSSSDVVKSSKNSGVTAEEAAAIVLAATRGRSPANFPYDRQTSSFGSFHGSKPNSNHCSGGISTVSVPAVFSASALQSDKEEQRTSNVMVATAIAKTAALVASREADSSEAGLTKEQKLKAERLKRAKTFAALIKSGNCGIGELVNPVNNHNGTMEPSLGNSMQMITDSDTMRKEREGSSIPFDAKALDKDESAKAHHSRSRCCDDDSGEEGKHSRKRRHSSRYVNDHKHRHRNDPYSEDEHRPRKNMGHRHRRRSPSSEDEVRERSEKHRRKHRSRSEKKQEIEVQEAVKLMGDVEEPLVKLPRVMDVRVVSPTHSNSDATEVPNDLRAKIRAMLLETLQ
ncbi:hypothetical protein HPP92_009604 [Vanilla planifolia]|uniref:SURP motif domain-containing protein n=1 Tax=Vanilla planifolia TaxID=51239 RepID=A0A835V4V2_VANPL|nr:hypothetical protein HPP92_009604 [Vanilla planifolia]